MSTKLSDADIAMFRDFRDNHDRRLRMMDDAHDQSVKMLGGVEKYKSYETWWAKGYWAEFHHAQDNFQRPEEVYDRFVKLVTSHASDINLMKFEHSFRLLNMPVIPMGALHSPNPMKLNYFRLVLSPSCLVSMTLWKDNDFFNNVDWIVDPRDPVATGMMSLFKNVDDRAGISSGSTVRTGDSGYKSVPRRQPRRPMVGPLEPRVFHQLGAVQSTTDRNPTSLTTRWTDTGFTLIVNMYDHHPWLLLNPAQITDAGPYMIPDGERQGRFPGLPQLFSLARLDFDSPDKNEPHLHRLFYRYNRNPAFSVTQIERCANFWIDSTYRNPGTGTVTRVGEPGEPSESPVEISRSRSRYIQQWAGGQISEG